MTPVIRIDDEVMDELKKRAVNFGLVFEPPNTTLRRVLSLDAENSLSSSDMKSIASKIVNETLMQVAENKKSIKLKLNNSSRKYVLIPLPKEKREFFPGYKKDFELEIEGETLTAHVTSEPKGDSVNVGDLHAGTHIRGKFGPWYTRHPELKAGDELLIEALEVGKRYRLSIINK